MHDSEKDVWQRFIKNDEKAFAALFEQNSDKLYNYGLKFTADEETLKDCIQDLFIKLYKNRHSLPELENPQFYLFRSFKNLLIDAMQQQQRMVYLPPQEIPFHIKFICGNQEEDVDDGIKEKFEKVINMLSDRQKEVIYLRYQANLSYDEISRLLGINYQSVRNLVHRSIEKIRSEVKK
ncbi:MAG: sigma-70 family RNA polymerase sigma factor [Tannerellaceae bacterium]|jgi:RNA polymerase sigma-70 factor (ECF subfamily)|nr:sigma-70 family RNA polymerase sigma factor [Tannerellaceae bacterium]